MVYSNITCGEIAEALQEQINTREIDGRGLNGRRSAWDRGLITYTRIILDNALEWRERATAPAPDHITREITAWLMDGRRGILGAIQLRGLRAGL